MLSIKSIKKVNDKKVKPGEYIARVTAVTDDENTVGIGAFIVHYKLTNPKTGDTKEFKEKFFCTTANQRTNELFLMMDELGLEDLDELVGVEFDVDIKTLVTSSGSSFPSIVCRKHHLPDDAPTEDSM